MYLRAEKDAQASWKRHGNGKDEGEGWRTAENPNCRTKLSRNQVPGNPRAFKYFGTIAKANYVADVRTGAALKRLDNGRIRGYIGTESAFRRNAELFD